MGAVFNIVGRIISTLLGVLVALSGAIWILQAFNIAFNGPMGPGGARSFMVSNHQWAIYGALAVLIGLWQVAWSNIRPAAAKAPPAAPSAHPQQTAT